jgi:hypothetical protein
MFLPRTSPSLNSSHLHSSGTSQTKARSTIPSSSSSTSITASNDTNISISSKRHNTSSSSGAWSQPTTAPASVQVHYHYLAGRYRDLSSEKGLGLVHSGIPSSSSNATLIGIPEGDRDDGDGSQDGNASIRSSNSKGKSASNSLRAIARKSGIKEEVPSSKRLDDLFLGGTGGKEKRYKGFELAAKTGVAEVKVTGTYSKSNGGGNGGPHGAKHGSLRSYAEERIKAHELVDARIQRATDTGGKSSNDEQFIWISNLTTYSSRSIGFRLCQSFSFSSLLKRNHSRKQTGSGSRLS